MSTFRWTNNTMVDLGPNSFGFFSKSNCGVFGNFGKDSVSYWIVPVCVCKMALSIYRGFWFFKYSVPSFTNAKSKKKTIEKRHSAQSYIRGDWTIKKFKNSVKQIRNQHQKSGYKSFHCFIGLKVRVSFVSYICTFVQMHEDRSRNKFWNKCYVFAQKLPKIKRPFISTTNCCNNFSLL